MLKDYSTFELVTELRTREGVETRDIEPCEPYLIDFKEDRVFDSGPATIMIVTFN